MHQPGSDADARAGSAMPPRSVAILGLGLIGGSIAYSLRDAGCRLVGYDTNADAVQLALSEQAINAAAPSPAAAADGADLIVIAAPVNAVVPLLVSALPSISSTAVVTDAGSVKSRIVRECDELLPGRFVGGHPMAGSESAGFASARAGLFAGAPWVLTLVEHTSASAVEAVGWLLEAVGATPWFCDPAAHDRIVAAVSHLPHLLAYGLAQVASDRVDDPWTSLVAGSFRDGTRVAKSLPEAWSVILADNRQEVAAALDAFIEWASSVRRLLDRGGESGLCEALAAANAARTRFPG